MSAARSEGECAGCAAQASTAEPPRTWMLCAPTPDPEVEQGRDDLFWSEEEQEWVESLDEATRFTDAEKAALDLHRFEDADPLEWWTSLPRPERDPDSEADGTDPSCPGRRHRPTTTCREALP